MDDVLLDGTDMLVAISFSVSEGEGTQVVVLSGGPVTWPLSFGLLKWFLCRILHCQRFLTFAG